MDVSALNLSDGDVIIVRGDVQDDEWLERLAEETGHFVIVLPAGTTIEALPLETVREMFADLERHMEG